MNLVFDVRDSLCLTVAPPPQSSARFFCSVAIVLANIAVIAFYINSPHNHPQVQQTVTKAKPKAKKMKAVQPPAPTEAGEGFNRNNNQGSMSVEHLLRTTCEFEGRDVIVKMFSNDDQSLGFALFLYQAFVRAGG